MVKIDRIQNSDKDLGRALYDDSEFTDVTLVCGDGQRIACHRSVLAASSEFLRRLLFESDQQQTFLFLGARVEVDEVRALLQLVYLGSSTVPRERVPALADLERELQIVERFNVDAPIQGEDLVNPAELVKPCPESQVVAQPDSDLKVQEGLLAPKENIQKEEDADCDKTFKVELFETCEEDNFKNMFSLNEDVKWEEIGKRRRSKKLPKVVLPPPDQFGEYTCDRCDYKNSDKFKVKYHLLIKHEGLSYDCYQCQSKFSRSDTLAIHVRRNHVNGSKDLFICDLCGKNLETKKGMKSHSAVQTCTKCNFISCGTSVQMHLKTSHNPYFYNGFYNCDQCEFRTGKYAKMNYHASSHFHAREIKPFIDCNQCEFKTNKELNLRAHVNDQHNSSQVSMGQDCELCQKSFSTRRLYLRHMKIRHGEIRRNCDDCDFKASLPYLLIEHKRTKHDFIKYNCDECEAKFNFKGSLKKHVDRVHKGKVFLCKVCQFVAKNYGSLKRHRKKIHLDKVEEEEDDARYTCDKCSLQFSRESALDKHKQNFCQDQIFQCEKCAMRFSSLGNLRRHTRNICEGREKGNGKTQICKARDCCRNVQEPRSEENQD